MFLLHPELKITLVEWSDGSINKFYAHDKQNIEEFIAAKNEWLGELSYKKTTLMLKELL